MLPGIPARGFGVFSCDSQEASRPIKAPAVRALLLSADLAPALEEQHGDSEGTDRTQRGRTGNQNRTGQ